MNTRELRQIRNKKAIKEFVAHGKLEKILILLAKAGIQWNLSFFTPGKLDAELIKSVYRQYSMKGKPVEIMDQMLKDNVFVHSSRDVAIALAMMNLNCHSEAFIVNMEFLRARKVYNEAAANISRGMSEKNLNREFNTGYNGLNVVTRIVNEGMLIDPYLSSTHSLQVLDMVLLNFFFAYPNNYVSIDKVKTDLKETYKPASIGTRATYLWKERGMLDKMPTAQKVASYRITQEGILTVGAIANRIVNMAAANFGI